MDVNVVGSATPDMRAVAVVGTWEPFLPFHAELLAQLRAHASAEQLTPIAIMLDPPPTMLQEGEDKWPLFHDAAERVRCLRAHGIDTTVVVRFVPQDLDRTAAEFFSAVSAPVHITEFWLRSRQILGQRAAGSQLAIAVQCMRRKVKLTKLPAEPVRELAACIRAHLSAGEVRAAAAAAGQSPVRHRPTSGPLRLAWRPGLYEATAHDADGDRLVTLDLHESTDGACTLPWPDVTVERLTFIRGPGDATIPIAELLS